MPEQCYMVSTRRICMFTRAQLTSARAAAELVRGVSDGTGDSPTLPAAPALGTMHMGPFIADKCGDVAGPSAVEDHRMSDWSVISAGAASEEPSPGAAASDGPQEVGCPSQ